MDNSTHCEASGYSQQTRMEWKAYRNLESAAEVERSGQKLGSSIKSPSARGPPCLRTHLRNNFHSLLHESTCSRKVNLLPPRIPLFSRFNYLNLGSEPPTACGHRIANRKLKETKQLPIMLPGPAVPGCILVSLHFLWAYPCPQPVQVRQLSLFFQSHNKW